MKECVVILGMHRSGTSVLSGLVSHQGFYLGHEEMPLREDNPKGFFENMKVYRLNQSILEDQNTSWDNHFFTCDKIESNDLRRYESRAKKIIKDEFGLVKRIFIKDPRMCLLFPLWEKVLTGMGFKIKVILAYRSPMEVAHSLMSRNKIDVEKSLMMWSHYFFQAEKTSRKYERLIVRYDEDFSDLDSFIKSLGKFLGGKVTKNISLAAHDLYTPKLKHHQLKLDSLSDEVPNYLKDFISILQENKFDQSGQLDEVIDEFYHSKKFFLYNENKQLSKISSLEESEKRLLLAAEVRERQHKESNEEAVQKLSEGKAIAERLVSEINENNEKRRLFAKKEADQKIKESAEAADRKIKENNEATEQKLKENKEAIERSIQEINDSNEKQRALAEVDAKQKLSESRATAERLIREINENNDKRRLSAEKETERKLNASKEAAELSIQKVNEDNEQQRFLAEKETEQKLNDSKLATDSLILEINESNQQQRLLLEKDAEKKLADIRKTTERLIREINEKNEKKLQSAKREYERKLQLVQKEADKVKSEKSQEIDQHIRKIEALRRQHGLLKKEGKKLQGDVEQAESRVSHALSVFDGISASPMTSKNIKRMTDNGKYFKFKRALKLPAKKKARRVLQDKALIVKSGMFSPFYYWVNNPDVWQAKVDPLSHFCNEGWRENRNPGPTFNTRDYLSMYDDVAHAGINPLLHYIRNGKSEGRRPFKNKQRKDNKNIAKNIHHSIGKKDDTPRVEISNIKQKAEHAAESESEISALDSDFIHGKFQQKASIPIVKINNTPARFVGLDENNNDFTHQAIASSHSETKVELLSLNESGVEKLSNTTFAQGLYVRDKYSDIERAFNICQNPQAVAITVWEGAHNPVGRAKVLYDVINTKRPAVIFAYLFGSFGRDLWEPLKSSGLNVVLIPYAERHAYHEYMQHRGVKFNTVWICKHRLHSFELASMISRPDTACVLDMDDNEDVFVSSKGSEFQPYGIFSKNKGSYFLGRVPVRSVASVSLKESYGGMLMRHARKEHSQQKDSAVEKKTISAVFIGTIRPHKNITDLVSAVSRFNEGAPNKIQLAIGGDFDPPSLRETLNRPHTTILGQVSNDALPDTLMNYDVIITGFPGESGGSKDINKYQITSKIGDGLAIGKAVLTPYSPAVDDLQNIPGLFVFTSDSFSQQLQKALEYNKTIKLPKEFTLEHSYNTFAKLEKEAKKKSVARDVFELEPFYQSQQLGKVNKKNIVLVWKQHDSGIYGRRIDILARYYKQRDPECNVTVIEAVSEWQLDQMMESKSQFDNSTVIINEKLSQKIYQYTDDGIVYRLITHSGTEGWNCFRSKFTNFLSAEKIYPQNTVMILFPLHHVFEELLDVFQNYKLIVDLVDNQIKWITTPEKRLVGLKQYYELISVADEVVSNSPQNLAFFKDLNFFGKMKPQIIPNWYTLPSGVDFNKKPCHRGEINLVYSGNLNDRIDWTLLGKVCTALAKHNGWLHIAGSTIRRPEEMKKLLNFPNCIYHGVVNEKHLLRLLQHMDFAVIPHVEDKISKFMDPIKLKMYKKLGLISLSTKLPGLPVNDPFIVVADSTENFLLQLGEMLNSCKGGKVSSIDASSLDEVAESYFVLINKLFDIQSIHGSQDGLPLALEGGKNAR